MRPLFFVLLVFGALTARADPPKFSEGGFVVALQYGPGFWGLDRAYIGTQLSQTRPDGQLLANTYVSDAQNTSTLNLHMGYNIKGHASIGINFTATGWSVFDSNRGGAGFLTGVVAWHPLELVFLNKETRPIPLDAKMELGFGYGIMGGPNFGADGFVIQWGIEASYWFNRFFALGAFVRGTYMKWGYFYLDFDHRDVPSNSVKLPNSSGGNFWHPGIEMLLRFGD